MGPDLMKSVTDLLNHGFMDSPADFLIQWLVCSFKSRLWPSVNQALCWALGNGHDRDTQQADL